MTERGSGAGLGANLNIPLPPGCGHAAYLYAFERLVVPALRAFKPDPSLSGAASMPTSSIRCGACFCTATATANWQPSSKSDWVLPTCSRA